MECQPVKKSYYIAQMSLCCRGELIYFGTPKIMGILNLTPDSFYDGGVIKNTADALRLCEKHISEGADFIDIGAMSTRPGALEISKDEEISRLLPVLTAIRKEFPMVLLSVDTYRSEVARIAVEQGADIINDISGGTMDAKMYEEVARLKVPYVLMHIKGNPATMQNNPTYNDVCNELLLYFAEKTEQLKSLGVADYIIDLGFGFGKTVEHNYTLLRNLKLFQQFEKPLLVGISRKSMIWKVLQSRPQDALNGTTVLNTIALLNGASILRVHDVKEAKECVKLVAALSDEIGQR